MTPERREKMLLVLAKRQSSLTVVLENVFDPHNVSAVMRTCDSVGVQDLYILNTRMPLHRKWGFKSSRSANKWLSVHQFSNAEKCFAEIKRNHSTVLATRLAESALSLYEVNFLDNVALVFGNECYGVSDEILPYIDGSFIIPQVGMVESLNISVACAVTLYEAYRQKDVAGHYNHPSLSPQKADVLLHEWTYKKENVIENKIE